MAKTVELKRASRYSIGGITFEKGTPKIVNDELAAILEEKVDSQDVPMFRVSIVKKSDIPVVKAPVVLAATKEEVGMSDEELAALEKKQAEAQEILTQAASEEDLANTKVEGDAPSEAAIAAAGKIKVVKKNAPVNEPTVTV